MSDPYDSHEMTILESKGILIKDQNYQVVLTNRRIILTSFFDKKLMSINLRDVQKIELDTNHSGDPIIIVFAPSVSGEIKKVILQFSKKNFPDTQVRFLWFSEINKRIQAPAPVSPDIPTKKSASAQAFCVTCGKKFVDGSVFCNQCGTKIIYPVQQGSPEQIDDITQDDIITPQISTRKIELTPIKISFSDADDSNSKEKVPVIESLHKVHQKKKSFFTRTDKRKATVNVVSALSGIIILIAACFLLVLSGSPGFILTSPGMNFNFPEFNVTSSAINPLVNTTTIAKITSTPEIPEPTPNPEVTSAQRALTSAMGDPATVLISYPSLFNTGNIAGLHALLSENIKSQYPMDTLNNELATARSNGYVIEKIQVNNQIIEGNSALLVVDISWKIDGSPITTTPIVSSVYENDQWKLDSLILYSIT